MMPAKTAVSHRLRRFATSDVCTSATEIPYLWRKFCPESGSLIGRRSNKIVLAIVYKWQKKDKRSQKGQM